LPETSTNGIKGKWNPAAIDNTKTGTYVFTPDPGSCANQVQVTVTVNPKEIPVFNQIPDFVQAIHRLFCQSVSNNGISGTWSPSVISNNITTTYTFTPDPSFCATTTQMTVTVTPREIPQFNPIAAICEGDPAPVLPTTSLNNIPGTWSPNIVNNTITADYTFTPNAAQCSEAITITIIVYPKPEIPVLSITEPTCDTATGSFEVTSSMDGLTFSLDGSAFAGYPAGGYKGLNTGNHILRFRNTNGCTNQVTVTIGSAPGAPNAPITLVDQPTCTVSTGSFTITSPTAGLTFSLDGGSFESYPVSGYTGLQPGPHTLQVKNTDGCTNSVTVTINPVPPTPEPPAVVVTDPTCDVPTGSFTITSPTAGLTFALDGGAFANYPASGYSGLTPGPHTLQVKNSDGCTNSVTVTINPAPPTPAVAHLYRDQPHLRRCHRIVCGYIGYERIDLSV
jgi:hypothetical protein